MLLINGQKGGKYIVKSLMLDKSLWRRLEAMGLTAGAPVEILGKKQGGTSIIRLRGARYAIGAEIAMGIVVEEGGAMQ